jgi:PleD family two-component response regulator
MKIKRGTPIEKGCDRRSRERFRNLPLRAWFEAPAKQLPCVGEGHRSVSKIESTAGPLIVLLVRGRGSWAPCVSRLLRLQKFIVHEAFSAKDARDALTANKIGFVIADLHLRDECGFSFSKRARELSPWTVVHLASSIASALRIANELCVKVSPCEEHARLTKSMKPRGVAP